MEVSPVNNTVAVIRGDCCVRSSEIKLDEFVLYPQLREIVNDIYQTVYERMDNADQEITQDMIRRNKELNESLRFLSLVLSVANLSQCSTASIVSNPEWRYVMTDSQNRILCGITADGKAIFYATDSEIMDCATSSYDPYSVNTLPAAISLCMTQLPSTTVENPEWNLVITDAEDKILYGTKADGSSVLYITPDKLWRYAFDSITIQ